MSIDETPPLTLPDLSELNRVDWSQSLRGYVESVGDYIELDAHHHVLQVGDGDRLLVTFESAADIRSNQDLGMPYGLLLAQKLNVTVMTIVCLKPTWFRAKPVYDFFDALTDQGVFDDFEHVCFYGVGLGGYAAAAFSVAAPGSDVVVISPHATLDPRLTEWDSRFGGIRRLSFTDRYGYAPDLVRAARHALVLYDPEDDLDAMHSALFARPSDAQGLTRFRIRHMGRDLASVLDEMGILSATIEAGLSGRLDLVRFSELYRARRDYGPYLRTLLSEVEDLDRPKLVTWLAQSVLERKNMPRMRRALDRVMDQQRASRAPEQPAAE